MELAVSTETRAQGVCLEQMDVPVLKVRLAEVSQDGMPSPDWLVRTVYLVCLVVREMVDLTVLPVTLVKMVSLADLEMMEGMVWQELKEIEDLLQLPVQLESPDDLARKEIEEITVCLV